MDRQTHENTRLWAISSPPPKPSFALMPARGPKATPSSRENKTPPARRSVLSKSEPSARVGGAESGAPIDRRLRRGFIYIYRRLRREGLATVEEDVADDSRLGRLGLRQRERMRVAQRRRSCRCMQRRVWNAWPSFRMHTHRVASPTGRLACAVHICTVLAVK